MNHKPDNTGTPVKQTVAVPLPDKGKAVVFEADLTNEEDTAFAARLKAAATTNPKDLQELIMALIKEK